MSSTPFSRKRLGASAERADESCSSAWLTPVFGFGSMRAIRTVRLDADSNVSVFDLDVVGAELDREVELVLAGAHVVLPTVPGAGEHAAFEAALAQRALQVQAVLLDRVEAAVAVGQRDLLLDG